VELNSESRQTIRILIVDDERTLRESCASILSSEGFQVAVAGRGDEALQQIRRLNPDIILLDLYLPDASGIDILQEAVRLNPACLVIAMTGKASVESSIEVLRAGAWSYLPKPFSAVHLNILIGRAAHSVVVARESLVQRTQPETSGHGHSGSITLLGKSESFTRVINNARRVAATDASVFIHGESGTGKELIAQFIHQNSRRSSREMVSVNSAAMPETLLESEMFGHVAGAFSGAIRDKKGLLEAAHGGTLFLDEINEMPLAVQAKLLRVIQDGVVRRLGSIAVDAIVDVRIIAATNQDPGEAVRLGKLRKDLNYRLCVFPIEIPPLRERPEDIVMLAQHYLKTFWEKHRPGERLPAIGGDAMEVLCRWRWPGNVRELRNTMEHTVVMLSPGAAEVDPEVISLQDRSGSRDGADAVTGVYPLHTDYHSARELLLADFEQTYLKTIVKRANGNLSDAARIAGIDRTTLYRLMEKHDFRKGDLTAAART
jgi:DNA-binding NtrC family response regulator